MRTMILDEGVRADGRKPNEVRPIWCEVGVIPRAHGSAVFTRGQTHVLSVATLAGPAMKQELDGVDPETEKTYMHKKYFPRILCWRSKTFARTRKKRSWTRSLG